MGKYLKNIEFYKISFLLLSFNLFISCNQQTDKIIVKDEGHFISFAKKEKPILSYQKNGMLPNQDIDSVYLRGGYIHPVYTPSGKIITDDYPSNHLHHHGIWSAWTKTVFEGRTPDFWNMGNATGTVNFVKVDSVFSESEFSGFHATHQFIDLTTSEEKIVLQENWEVKIYNDQSNYESDPPYYLFDINISQYCEGSSPLILPEYHYGGIGFRGRGNWDGAENADFLSSEGKTRSNGNETRARWCHIGGLVDNEWVGITIMNHKDNFRFPQPMRIHPDEPFFCFAPSQLGTWSITPEDPYLAKYRFVVYDGKPDTILIETLWKNYNE